MERKAIVGKWVSAGPDVVADVPAVVDVGDALAVVDERPAAVDVVEPLHQPVLLGEVAMQESVVEYGAGTLGALAENREPILYEAADLAREDYAHLNVRRTIQSLAYVV